MPRPGRHVRQAGAVPQHDRHGQAPVWLRQYRYSTTTCPNRSALREALYPHLLVIASGWVGRLGRPAPWPDTLAEWVEMCHRAGQGKSAQILLRNQAGDWNALHRDVFGDLVFPLQVVVGLVFHDA